MGSDQDQIHIQRICQINNLIINGSGTHMDVGGNTGAGNTRWAATLVDATGSAQIVAFRQFIPLSAAAINRGDTIAVLNGEKGEWGGRPQVKCGPGTKVVIIADAEDVPGF